MEKLDSFAFSKRRKDDHFRRVQHANLNEQIYSSKTCSWIPRHLKNGKPPQKCACIKTATGRIKKLDPVSTNLASFHVTDAKLKGLIDGSVAGHLGTADGLKTLSIHVCVCPHFGM